MRVPEGSLFSGSVCMFLPFDFLGFLGRFIHSSSRYYYLFFNYLSYYLYGCPLYAKSRA